MNATPEGTTRFGPTFVNALATRRERDEEGIIASVSVALSGPLVPASLLDRPHRFSIRARCGPDDEVVEAHLPDPGRLSATLVPGARVWLRASDSPRRRTAWTAVLAQASEGILLSLDTQLPNRLVKAALQQNALPEFDGFDLERTEAPVGRSRFDFLLRDRMGHALYLEVKGVTWSVRGVGRFPDAPSARAARHLAEAIRMAGRPATSACVLFICQRHDVEAVEPASDIDPVFCSAFAEARAAGVRFIARRCLVTLSEVTLGISLPVRGP
ncbi:MAG: DNA/RNA nuclease SfsA [Myxococcota bacterium]